MHFPLPTLTEAILLILVALSFLFQLWFLLRRVRPLAFYKNKNNNTEFNKPVSVIVCAKNEAENLERFLPTLLEQDYPELEVVVVNDSSEDDSDMVLARLKAKYPHLYYTTIPKDRIFSHGKKLALTIGVKAAKYDYLLLTDADCRPAGTNWIRRMVAPFAGPKTEMILGYGGYSKEKGFCNLLVRYDTFFTAIQYLGFALSSKPYMGVGRNLAYTKQLFVNNNGVKNHAHILSGDDDLFVQQVIRKDNYAVSLDQEAQTLSIPPKTLRDWRNQKGRHLSTSSYYKTGVKTELAIEPVSRQLFLLSSIILVFFNTFAIAAACLLLFRLMLQLVLWAKAASVLNQGRLFWSVLLFDIIHPWLLLWAKVGTFNRRKRTQWK